MMKASYLVLVAAAIGLTSLSPTPSQALPLAKSPAVSDKTASDVLPAHYRRRHWYPRYRYRYYPRYYGYYPHYYAYRPYRYRPYRYGYYQPYYWGYGPGISLHFGRGW
jgi:hypothetical protein